MKKHILLLNAIILLSVVKSNAQTICDSIIMDTAYVNSISLNLTVYNSSHHFIVYPFFTAILDANPYIVLTDTTTVPSFLSIPTDANAGFTSATYMANVPAASLVPLNTVFSGTLKIRDPNDSTFSCDKPFSFIYGTMTTSVNELNTEILQLYPNPSNGQFTVLLPTENSTITIADMLGQQLLKTETTQNTTSLKVDKKGVYFIYIATKQGTIKRKLIVN